MAAPPKCANAIEGTCERSDVYVSKETDNAFVITCRTCKSISVWPKDRDDNHAKYQAFLKHQAARTAQERYESLKAEHSFPWGK